MEGHLRLADGSLLPVLAAEVRAENELIYSNTAQVPDEDWSATDAHGHEHRYVRDSEDVPRLPSLDRRRRHVDCDGTCYGITGGDCDGYEVDEWFCRECGDVVEPGFKPDYRARDNGIPVSTTTTYTLTVETPNLLDTIEDATYVRGEFERSLPPLHNTKFEMESWFGEARITGVYVADEIRAVKQKPVGP